MAIDKIFNDANVDGIADNIFGAVNNSVSEVKQMQQRKAAENVQMVVEAFKKIETNITEKFDNVTDVIEKRVLTIKDGRDGSSGSDGRNGRDGKPGRDGVNGKQGTPGTPGKDGVDGEDGVSVTNANIDFDGSLVISLSSGQQINVGEVVAPDLAEKIKIVSTMSTNGAVGIKDEGSSISTGVKNINFVGATVTATASGDDVTVNVSAGTGTVQSVAATVPAFLSVAGSPITTTGTLAISLSGTALPVANGGTGITSFGTGVATALGVNTGTAGAFVVNGGALGSPSSVGTMPAFTLGGTVSGGGNQINNVVIGTTTPLAGAFTTLSATGTITQTGSSGNVSFNQNQTITGAIVNTRTAVGANSLGAYDQFATKDNTGTTNTWAVGVNVNSANSSWELYNGGTRFSITQAGVATLTGTLTVAGTGTLSGGTSGTGYSFSGSAPAGSLTLDASGNLGIGTSSPAQKLTLNTVGSDTMPALGANGGKLGIFSGGLGYGLVVGVPSSGTATLQSQYVNGTASALDMSLQPLGGNVGIGTSSPAAILHTSISGSGEAGRFATTTDSTPFISIYSNGGIRAKLRASTAETALLTQGSTPLLLGTNDTERARIDSSGNLLVGTTSLVSIGLGTFYLDNNSKRCIETKINTTAASDHIAFFSSTGQAGQITVTNTVTAYGTSSDYRLKNTIAPMTGALAKVAQLKPCTYKWNADDSDGEGFIAHELAEVCPSAVTGIKDAVDKDGNIKPQGIDVSFLVATLTAAIQEQQALITQLTARITALETA